MIGHLKHAGDLASSTGLTAPSPIPTPSIAPAFAPGKKGPTGLAPRTNYSRVNTGEPPTPDAGGSAQKSMPPRGAEMLSKLGGEGPMGKIAGRATLQDLVKSAMVESANRVRVTDEATRQAENLGEKTASASTSESRTKVASSQEVEKLASALDFLANNFRKEAESSAGTAGAQPPPGVSASPDGKPLPLKKGEGVHTVPLHPGFQPGEGTLMANDEDRAPGGRERMVQKNASVISIIRAKQAVTKQASPQVVSAGASVSSLADYMLGRTKQAEDAINPARISAPKAVPPETSASGEAGGQPVGGAPQGPAHLIDSNAAAVNYTRGEAYANRKSDLKKYFDEPAMSSQHDSVLQDALEHTRAAGPKIASAESPASGAPSASVKTAAARALLTNLAKSAEQEISKTAAKQNNTSTGLTA